MTTEVLQITYHVFDIAEKPLTFAEACRLVRAIDNSIPVTEIKATLHSLKGQNVIVSTGQGYIMK